jgi:hypothetical protein
MSKVSFLGMGFVVYFVFFNLVGCSSPSSTSSSTGSSPNTEYSFFPGNTTPRVSSIRHHQNGNYQAEYLIMKSSVTMNISNYSVEDTNGNIYTFPSGTMIYPKAGNADYEINLQTTLATSIVGPNLFGWGKSGPVWDKGADVLTLKNQVGATVQSSAL